MKGHGEKLSRKAGEAAVALLACPTVAEAATRVGIPESTLWRWLQRDDFREQYHAARRQTLDVAVLGLQQAASEAVQALRRNLTCGVPSVEVRAAAVILEQAIGATELLELEARVQQLEAWLQERRERRGA